MFAMISNQAWQPNFEGQEYCIINNTDAACQLPNTVAVIAFLASIGFLVGEYFFDQMSSAKSRKHFVLADLAFSGKSPIFKLRVHLKLTLLLTIRILDCGLHYLLPHDDL